MPSAKLDLDSKICKAALDLAAKKGWRTLTMDAIATTAKLSPAKVRQAFPDKNRLLPGIMRYIDDRTAVLTSKIDPRSAPRERLFEVMMARFDALQEHRSGILAIVHDSRQEPRLACVAVRQHGRSMKKMLILAQLSPQGVHAPVVTLGLLAVYYRALWEWQRDQSADMAKTMAALDRGLRLAGRAAELLLRDF